MSHKTIYECDQCKKEIGKKNHITLMLSAGSGTGIAKYSLGLGWTTVHLGANFIHFCNAKCIGTYFDIRLKGADGIKNKK